MNKNDDPYEILEVSKDADAAEIKKSYRKLALKYHPDRQTTEDDKEKSHSIFARLSAAYEILSDEEKRKEFDIRQEKRARKAAAKAAKEAEEAQPKQKREFFQSPISKPKPKVGKPTSDKTTKTTSTKAEEEAPQRKRGSWFSSNKKSTPAKSNVEEAPTIPTSPKKQNVETESAPTSPTKSPIKGFNSGKSVTSTKSAPAAPRSPNKQSKKGMPSNISVSSTISTPTKPSGKWTSGLADKTLERPLGAMESAEDDFFERTKFHDPYDIFKKVFEEEFGEEFTPSTVPDLTTPKPVISKKKGSTLPKSKLEKGSSKPAASKPSKTSDNMILKDAGDNRPLAMKMTTKSFMHEDGTVEKIIFCRFHRTQGSF